jgi:hypothetical protein
MRRTSSGAMRLVRAEGSVVDKRNFMLLRNSVNVGEPRRLLFEDLV